MGIEDELNDRLGSRPGDGQSRTLREIEGERLIREMRQLFKDLADALLARGIPTETILMRSPVPSSRLKHYFLGAQSNPLVPGAEGWEIIRNWKIDTFGALWVPNRQQGYEGEWRKVDLTWWQEQFSRDNWHGMQPFIDQTGHYLYLMEEADGPSWLKLYRTQYTTGLPDRWDEVREGLLQATAEFIARHSPCVVLPEWRDGSHSVPLPWNRDWFDSWDDVQDSEDDCDFLGRIASRRALGTKPFQGRTPMGLAPVPAWL